MIFQESHGTPATSWYHTILLDCGRQVDLTKGLETWCTPCFGRHRRETNTSQPIWIRQLWVQLAEARGGLSTVRLSHKYAADPLCVEGTSF